MTRTQVRNPLGTKEAVQEMLARGEIVAGRSWRVWDMLTSFLGAHPIIAGLTVGVCAIEGLALLFILEKAINF